MTAPTIKTPRGIAFINEANMKAELKWNPDFQPKWQGRFTKAQKFVDSEVLRLCEPYMPILTGMLIMTGILGTDVGSGSVNWIAPYARYLYYGKVMAGKPKHPTSKNLKYHGGGVRGSFWFERMKAVSGRQIIAAARKIAGGQ